MGEGLASGGHARDELLRLSIEAAPTGIAMFDRDMRYIAASRRYREDLGIAAIDPIGRSHYEIFPEIPERWRAIHRRCLAGATESCEEDPFPRADGTLEWYRWEIRPWHEPGGAIGGVVLFSQNVTREVVERGALRRWADAFENAAFGIAVGRPGTDVIEFANTAYAAMRGMTVDEVRGKTPAELYPAGEQDRVRAMMATADRQGQVDFETRCLHRDGSTVPIHVHVTSVRDGAAAPLYRIVTVLDISERRRAETMAHEHQARLRAVMDHSVDGLITIDEDGTVTSFSRPAERMFGLGAAEVVGRDVRGLLAEDAGGPPGGTSLAALLARGSAPGAGTELIGRRKDGTTFPMELAIGEISSQGSRREFVGAVRDITGRVEAEAQLRQAQKMEAIGQLTGGLAHDFNNLLGVITGNLELAAAKLRPGERTRVRIDAAIAAAWRGADLTSRLLAFSRRKALQPRRLVANEIAVAAAKLLRRTLGETIEITLELAPDLWPIVADPVQLQACLMNLATNGRDAMPSGGRLTIASANRTLGPRDLAGEREVAAGDYVMVAVGDTGAGMAPDVAARIFEPFFTTKEVGQGSGLGLSMVFGFVKQSGGHVAVESVPGAGTTVRLYLPRATAAASATAPPLAVDIIGRGERVLVVEDNDDLRRVAVDQLTDLGYRVLAADRPAGALEILSAETVDLLFTDIVMPGGIDGIELARRVIARWPGVRILLTSGYADARSLDRLADGSPGLGRPVHLLDKPYARDDLARALRAALDAGAGPAGPG